MRDSDEGVLTVPDVTARMMVLAPLRDWFAGQALAGMLASPPMTDRTRVSKRKWAGLAYEWADAMLAARGGK